MHRMQPMQLDRFTRIECLGVGAGVGASVEGPNRKRVAPAATEDSRNCLLVTVPEFFDDISDIFYASFFCLPINFSSNSLASVLEFGQNKIKNNLHWRGTSRDAEVDLNIIANWSNRVGWF